MCVCVCVCVCVFVCVVPALILEAEEGAEGWGEGGLCEYVYVGGCGCGFGCRCGLSQRMGLRAYLMHN